MSESNITQELQERNAENYQVRLSEVNARLDELETQITTLTNHVQTCINLVHELQRTNALAIAKVRGTGPTG